MTMTKSKIRSIRARRAAAIKEKAAVANENDPETTGAQAVREAREWAERCHFPSWVIGPDEVPARGEMEEKQEALYDLLFRRKKYKRSPFHVAISPIR